MRHEYCPIIKMMEKTGKTWNIHNKEGQRDEGKSPAGSRRWSGKNLCQETDQTAGGRGNEGTTLLPATLAN
jgi:hypothetical protein